MKRMNEIFDLPVSAYAVAVPYWPNRNNEDEHIANAINHVDALADALADLIKEVEYLEDNACTIGAKAALAAYRGDK